MATIQELQKQLDDKTLDPSQLNKQQRAIIDELIQRGELTGPTTGELGRARETAAKDIARADEFYADPIGKALEAEDSFFSGWVRVVFRYLGLSGFRYGSPFVALFWYLGPILLSIGGLQE